MWSARLQPGGTVVLRMKRQHATSLLIALVLLAALVPAGLQALHWLRNRAYGAALPICRVNTSSPVVALSLDDGPDPAYTGAVLSLLTRYNDRATFFLTGEHAATFPSLVSAELSQAMEVGDQTWSHPRLATLSSAAALREVTRTRRLLERQGADVTLFRAPYGEMTAAQSQAVEGLGLQPIHWSVPLEYYLGLGLEPDEAAQALLRDIRPGDIILAHDARDGGISRASTVSTLQRLLPALARRGIRVTTVSDLLSAGLPVFAQPRTWFWQSGFQCPDETDM